MSATAPADERSLLRQHVTDDLVEATLALFDDSYYASLCGTSFPDRRAALEHYLAEGGRAGLDPNPYFDTVYYRSQDDRLRRQEENALVHYVERAPRGKAPDPNPLFSNTFYLETHTDLRGRGVVPFAHFVERGRLQGRVVSKPHRELNGILRGRGRPQLLRGRWQTGNVLFFLSGRHGAEAVALRDRLARERNITATVVFVRRPPDAGAVLPADVLVLEELRDRLDVERPSTLRLLGLILASKSPMLAVTDREELLPGASAAGTPAYVVAPDEEAARALDLGSVAAEAARIVFDSREALRSTAVHGTTIPPNVALRPPSTGLMAATLELAERDGALAPATVQTARRSQQARPKILVPATDWSVSGVNAALETMGRELTARGWDVEIVFTRDRSFVEQSVGSERHLPELPYRWLDRRRPGVDGMWEALIAEIQEEAPCVVFTGYDFFANSVVPALTNDVGVVMWLQADDGDYYEQAYRLGRYCNALVCVSERIREHLGSLHPGIAERAHVVHNTSVRFADVVARPQRDGSRLRIVYTGRLVQYQKRVLDFVDLANELESHGLDFTIDLVGTAPPHDEAAALLPRRAARHLEAGTMRILGRLSRAQVLDELRSSDLFVLLSDFEGLPLSLVEAMAAGCVPVVAEMQSGISEVLVPGESGLVVQGRDYAEWARIVADLWGDGPRLRAMSARAQETIRESFTAERIGEQFDAVFRRVAEELASGYVRPPALTWGEKRALFGDVLPPPPMYRAVPVPGLG